MTGRPRPLAVGLLHSANHASQAERTRARIALALKATDEGYALLETYETNGNPVREDAAFSAMEALARRLDVQAVIFAGDVDLPRLHDVADRERLVVVCRNWV